MEHKSYSPQDQAAITALRKRIQGYCCQNSNLAQDIRTRNAVNDLWARLMAYNLEQRMWHESCTANVLTEEEAEGFSEEAVKSERYGIARGEDQLDEVDIRGSAEASRPTFVSHNLTPEAGRNRSSSAREDAWRLGSSAREDARRLWSSAPWELDEGRMLATLGARRGRMLGALGAPHLGSSAWNLGARHLQSSASYGRLTVF
ncbi:hypothetical protein Droror1_Dr00021718 [Drosera rotundifolia]